MMHAGNPDRSIRLRETLAALRRYQHGMTTSEIAYATGSVAPATDVSELRQNGYAITCKYVGLSVSGRKLYSYTLHEEPKP